MLKLKTPWRDGTTHLVMSPLEFRQRLAARVPRPRLHQAPLSGGGVRVLNAKLGALVAPQEPEPTAQAAKPAECQANGAHHPDLAAELSHTAQARKKGV